MRIYAIYERRMLLVIERQLFKPEKNHLYISDGWFFAYCFHQRFYVR